MFVMYEASESKKRKHMESHIAFRMLHFGHVVYPCCDMFNNLFVCLKAMFKMNNFQLTNTTYIKHKNCFILCTFSNAINVLGCLCVCDAIFLILQKKKTKTKISI